MTYAIDKALQKVVEVPPYLAGLGRDALSRVDFADAFEVEVPPHANLELANLAKAGYEACPKWVRGMLGLRDALMGPLGLKTGRQFQPQSNADWERAIAALHPAYSDDGNEVMLGIDDWHLDFRVSVLKQRKLDSASLILTTLVKFNHWLGRAYFVPVGIGHKWIVPAMLAALQTRLMQMDSGGGS